KTSSDSNGASNDSSTNPEGSAKPSHFKITLHRSAIAGKILRLKELVKVENVTTDQVKTKREMKLERRAVRGYVIKQRFRQAGAASSTIKPSIKDTFTGVNNWRLDRPTKGREYDTNS
ncbi:10183_t:CDS:2, partial [Acaulospora colombiana]